MAALSLRHLECLAEVSRQALDRLADRDWCDEVYLAGSAALALYCGHRPVEDLDLMSQVNRLTGAHRRDLLQDLLEMDPGARVETARDGFLHLRLARGPMLRFFYYPYPLVDPERWLGGVAVASPLDLGLMKIAAIISRGSRRDFVDLFLLCREFPLEAILERADDKFGHVRDFPLQALKGLADLSLVAGEPMPRLSRPLDWKDVETWLAAAARRLGRRHVGLEAR